MQKEHPPILTDMTDALFGDYENLLETDDTFVNMGALMCKDMSHFGATAIAYKGITDKIHKKIGNYYVLPSSLHELIIVRDREYVRVSELKDMVLQANRTVVDASDKLSDSVFYYDGILHRVA